MITVVIPSAEPDVAPEEASQPAEKLSRKERKRLETRARILAATEQLIGKRPLDELTIAEITEAADVGHGTFYLHFKTKYEVVVSIVYQHAAQWDEAIQDSLKHLDDPAEVVSCSARHVARLLTTDPLCRWFFQHSGVPAEELREATGVFFVRDIKAGLSSGRFRVSQLDLSISFLFGGIVNTLLPIFDQENPEALIDDLAEMVLRVLGIPADEAREIASSPLPHLPLTA